ncbi:MAG: ribulose-phosphate 3-epimerase [Floccifex sp.]
MRKILCPSMMCADFTKIKEEMAQLENSDIDIYHCDIMDGSFVENMALAINDVKAIRQCTNKKIDVHLMMENPAHKVDWFIDAGADILYIHPESERYASKTIKHIHSRNKEAGIAINPDTSIESVKEILKTCDYVLVMTVNPGFAGQSFIDTTMDKIKELVQLKQQYPFKIIIDGSCSYKVIEECSKIGVDGFVLGTSALFGKGKSYQECVRIIRNEEEK